MVGKKDISKLVPKKIVDRRGRTMTVYVVASPEKSKKQNIVNQLKDIWSKNKKENKIQDWIIKENLTNLDAIKKQKEDIVKIANHFASYGWVMSSVDYFDKINKIAKEGTAKPIAKILDKAKKENKKVGQFDFINLRQLVKRGVKINDIDEVKNYIRAKNVVKIEPLEDVVEKNPETFFKPMTDKEIKETARKLRKVERLKGD